MKINLVFHKKCCLLKSSFICIISLKLYFFSTKSKYENLPYQKNSMYVKKALLERDGSWIYESALRETASIWNRPSQPRKPPPAWAALGISFLINCSFISFMQIWTDQARAREVGVKFFFLIKMSLVKGKNKECVKVVFRVSAERSRMHKLRQTMQLGLKFHRRSWAASTGRLTMAIYSFHLSSALATALACRLL